MSHHSEPTGSSAAARWVDDLIREAYPETAGVTLAAVEALAGQETFSRAQVAYLAAVFMGVGAQVRSAADRAELTASRAAGFDPAPTREVRIALRSATMLEQAEIAWLRRTGEPRTEWAGGTAEEAAARFGWEADRPDLPDLGPSAASWHPRASVPTHQVGRGRYAWKDEA